METGEFGDLFWKCNLYPSFILETLSNYKHVQDEHLLDGNMEENSAGNGNLTFFQLDSTYYILFIFSSGWTWYSTM